MKWRERGSRSLEWELETPGPEVAAFQRDRALASSASDFGAQI